MKQPNNNRLKWSDIYFVAESENEPFTDLNIVTAKSELLLLARSEALLHLLSKHLDVSPKSIDDTAKHLIETNQVKVYEHSYIQQNNSIVCIDVDRIDDNAIWRSLDLVYEAVSNNGIWAAPNCVQYSWAELTSS